MKLTIRQARYLAPLCPKCKGIAWASSDLAPSWRFRIRCANDCRLEQYTIYPTPCAMTEISAWRKWSEICKHYLTHGRHNG